MFEYSVTDSEWGLQAWDLQCVEPTVEHEMHCCMAHLLTSAPVLCALGGNHPVGVNIEFCGYRNTDRLVKRHPCSAYINYIDFDYVNWVGQEYSNLLTSEKHTRLTPEELVAKSGKNCNVINGHLKEGESFSNLESIVARITKSRGLKSSASFSVNDTPSVAKVMDVMWIYCINRKWNRVELMEPFRPDQAWQLITLVGGNMILMSNTEIDKSRLFRKTKNRPIYVCNEVTDEDFFKTQIYIYKCLDGYFEFIPSERSPGALFPFANPVDDYESILETEPHQYVTIITQYVNSGQLDVISDIDAGNTLLDYLFSPEFIEYCIDFNEDQSESSMEDSPIVQRHEIARAVRREYASKKSLERDITKRISGVAGIYWRNPSGTHYYGRWQTLVTYGGKNYQKYFPLKSHSEEQVEQVLELAVNHMNNVLLPDRRSWEVTTGYVAKCFSKRNILERISGVTGVSWYKLSGSSHDFGRWISSVYYGGKYHQKKFPVKSNSEKEVERVLELAIDHLNNVLLPEKHRWVAQQDQRLQKS